MRPNVGNNVAWGSKVYTDALPAYEGLSRQFVHSSIDHSVAFVRGVVHTNGIENFWSLFKRSLKGTWTHVATFHLQRYFDEQAWRFNLVLGGTVGSRITYRQLCAIDDAGFMGKR